MAWDGENRRKLPRVLFPCLIKLHDVPLSDAMLTHTENLSSSGACVIVKTPVSLETTVDIEIDLMDAQENMCCRGKVIWLKQRPKIEELKPLSFDMGIEFLNLNQANSTRLKAVVNHYLKNRQKFEE